MDPFSEDVLVHEFFFGGSVDNSTVGALDIQLSIVCYKSNPPAKKESGNFFSSKLVLHQRSDVFFNINNRFYAI